ncbi:hypothetical protein GOV09_06855, partial [Candidatus Woesearchaeota archaeon]|nr:hypothetical protein [Candidatus Woesearchaeota archaeon]
KKFSYEIGFMEPGDNEILRFKIDVNAKFDTVLPTQINSDIIISEEQEIFNITEEIIIEDNKTVIKVDVEFNESVLAAEEVLVKQYIPKCLLEEINNFVAKSNRKFTIINEDPVIMWQFESIVSPEQLQLEIDAVADEDCLNKIRTEILAKKLLAEQDEFDWGKASLQLMIPLFLILGLVYGISRLKKKKTFKKSWHIGLLIFSIFFIAYNVIDALSLLPESLDFLKKLLSWTFMIALLYHVSLRDLLFHGKAKWFDILLITSFILLSVKNVIYIAFKTYGNEMFFGDLALVIIKHSEFLEKELFFFGMVLFIVAILIAWLFFRLDEPSFADLINRTEKSLVSAKTQKLFVVFILLSGFFIVFFNLLFGWFSIAFDGPFLVVILLFSIGKLSLEKTAEEPDIFIEKFLKLFTHRRNRLIAFSALPVIIFIVESYNYLAYILFKIKSIYFEVIEQRMPILFDLVVQDPSLAGIYILQIAGLISALTLAFLFWWHFFLKRERKEKVFIKDRPDHPFLFSLLLGAFISYLVRPVFSISQLNNSKISGLFLMLKEIPADNLLIIYLVSFLPLLSYFLFRHYKRANILPYGMVLFAIATFTGFFAYGFGARILGQLQGIALDFGLLRVVFIGILFLVFMVTILYSLYALARELFMLFEEEFGHTLLYRRLAKIFQHHVKVSEHEAKKINAWAEHLFAKGFEEYIIVERLEKHTGLREKQLVEILDIMEEKRHDRLNHAIHPSRDLIKLHKNIKKLYLRKKMRMEDIIEHCLKQGWTQDDIAAAALHMHHKHKDKALFHAMRRAL